MDNQVAVKPPTDFSELHRVETARRLREEEEKNQWIVPEVKEPVQQPPRQLTEEEIKLWEALEDSDEEEEEEQVEDIPWDDEYTEKVCKEHLNKRLEILRSGAEDFITREEYKTLPVMDKLRLEFIYENDVDYSDTMINNFIVSRIQNTIFEEISIGYRVLLEMYDPILAPEFYYLSLWEGSPGFDKWEEYYLFGI
uniref:Dynein regulatory complex subunit 7 n=1 Tax=Caenorhabditis tropicalis TaxID=1561998 RepID=A0A1I7T0E7_9PELO